MANSMQAQPLSESPPFQRSPLKPSLATIAIQSFNTFRSQTSAQPVPIAVQSPVRRKPLPAASPIVTRSSAGLPNSLPRTVADKPNLPSLQTQPRADYTPSPTSSEAKLFLPRNLDYNPHGQTPVTETSPDGLYPPRKSSLTAARSPVAQSPRHDRSASNIQPRRQSRIEELRTFGSKGWHARSPTMPNMPLYTSDSQPQGLNLKMDGTRGQSIDDYQGKPKSPAGGFTSFFGWNSSKAQNEVESPLTSFSDRSSPAASPRMNQFNTPSKSKPNALDIPAANSLPSYFNIPGTPLLSHSPQMNAHVEELERELREVSSELASSIQREMELEDEVERWKAESSTGMPDNRRTSDYYSDAGTSSIRFPIGDPESKMEELETLRRKAEQERAQLKMRMAERLSEELRRRRDLEEQVHQLEDKVSDKSRAGSLVETPREKELTTSLEDAKRRLAEEKQVKENFEDLLTALRQELEKYRNEADNLREQVVPQLKARLEVLETEAVDTEKLVFETTRMQQEIQQLKTENQSFANARRLQQDGSQQQVRFQSIAEEADNGPSTSRIGLTRSNSLARNSAFIPKRGSLSRSNSVKDRSGDASPREGQFVSNPVKELEEQRDALHKALKLLLQRQELQQKDFHKRIRELEAQRDAALNLTPRRTAFHKEVADLRQEVNSLRRRADGALEQKWHCEKGLGGLRMDLDRAQQETSSLRDLLKEHDITIPEIGINSDRMSLDKAYSELETTRALSLARVRQLESIDGDALGAAGAEVEKTLNLLKQSISDADADREYAQKEAEQYRRQARDLQISELDHLGKEQKLSSDLFAATSRMDQLSSKIEQQLKANSSLRGRLAEAITRGELEQQKSTEQIIDLERRLKTAEDKVMVAQLSSEETVAKHEGEVQLLRDSQTGYLRRVKSGLLSSSTSSPKMPSSPMFAQRSPRLGMTSSGPAMTFTEATKTASLETRVEELEKALRDADREMEEVVGRMNSAQIEVADLQFERDEAMRQTRKLQADILAEREKVKLLMASS